jgi:DNA-binding CsgD family transcriptional regulator
MAKRHVVELTDDERAALSQQEAGPLTRRQRYRARILLRSDAGDTDEEIADEAGAAVGTVANVRRRFASGGLDAALNDRPRPGAKPILDGEAEALVIATACGPVPEGRATWTARLLANRPVELRVVEGVSEDTILRVLKKVNSSRGRSGRGAPRRA